MTLQPLRWQRQGLWHGVFTGSEMQRCRFQPRKAGNHRCSTGTGGQASTGSAGLTVGPTQPDEGPLEGLLRAQGEGHAACLDRGPLEPQVRDCSSVRILLTQRAEGQLTKSMSEDRGPKSEVAARKAAGDSVMTVMSSCQQQTTRCSGSGHLEDRAAARRRAGINFRRFEEGCASRRKDICRG